MFLAINLSTRTKSGLLPAVVHLLWAVNKVDVKASIKIISFSKPAIIKELQSAGPIAPHPSS